MPLRSYNAQSRAKHSQHGFTLPELIISITLIGLLSLFIANFVADWLRTSSQAQARTALLSNAQNALDNIRKDIKLSGNADLNNRWPDSNAPGGPYGWQSDNDTLVLAHVATDDQNEVIFSDESEYITEKDSIVYYLDGQKLYRRVIASDHPDTAATTTCPPGSATSSCPADRKVGEDVASFSVSYYDADDQVVAPDYARAVQLSITISQEKGGEQVDATYTTRMVFRNE